jgi:hypothetical protein
MSVMLVASILLFAAVASAAEPSSGPLIVVPNQQEGMSHDRPVWRGGSGEFNASALVKVQTEVERIRKAPPQTRVVARVAQAALDRAPRYEPRVAGVGR